MDNPNVPVWAFSGLLLLFNGLLGLMMMRLWKSVDENTAALVKLAVSLPTEYTAKADMIRQRTDDLKGYEGVRTHLNELRDKLWKLETRVAVIDGGVRDAQAELLRGA